MKLRKFFVLFIIASALLAEPLFAACERREGYAELGGYNAVTNLYGATYKYMRSFPNATVTVYNSGTTTLSTIYATSTCTTVKTNPMVADTNGYYYFYASGSVFDIKFSGGGITVPFTRRSTLATVDVSLCGTCMFTDTEQSSEQRKVFTENEVAKEPLKVYPPDDATAAGILIEENDAGGDANQRAITIYNEADTIMGWWSFNGRVYFNNETTGGSSAETLTLTQATGNTAAGLLLQEAAGNQPDNTYAWRVNNQVGGVVGSIDYDGDLAGRDLAATGTSTLATANITTANITTLNATTTSVIDNTFSIKDNADNTKVAQFQASSISPATTRTYTFPDKSMTLGDVTTDTIQTITAVKTIDVTSAATGLTIDNDGAGYGLLSATASGIAVYGSSASAQSGYFFPSAGANAAATVNIRAANGQAEVKQLLIEDQAGTDVAFVDEDGDATFNSLTETTPNLVTLGTTQSPTGEKTWSGLQAFSGGVSIDAGAAPAAQLNKARFHYDAVTDLLTMSLNGGAFYDVLSSNTGVTVATPQTITGQKTFSEPNGSTTSIFKSGSDLTTDPTVIIQDSAGAQAANTKLLDFRSSVGASLAYVDKEGDASFTSLLVGGGSVVAAPFVDTTTIIKGSADATKLLRFEVDGFTAGATRVATFQDANTTVAGTNLPNTFTAHAGQDITVNAGTLGAPTAAISITGTGDAFNNFDADGIEITITDDGDPIVATYDAGVGVTLQDTQGSNLYLQFVDTSAAPVTEFTVDGTGMVAAAGGMELGGGDILSYSYRGSDTWNPGNLADGAVESKDVTVTGAAAGSPCYAGHPSVTTGWLISCNVRALNTATVVIMNKTGAPVDLASDTVKVVVLGF